VGKLLAALEGELGTMRRAATSVGAVLVEPLTGRELEVLRHLTTHLSSTEIAQALYISPNTVRSHIKNIYGKLGVHSRNDAVQRAHDFGLL
jgi:LuxR family maltose regulon positive regulatory protein